MIRWGIIGLGNMAQKFAQSIKENNNAKLIAISSLNSEKLKTFKNEFQIDKSLSFDNYNDLIKCTEIDAIYIATLNNTHLDLIKLCAENKKNILCEKPMSLNIEEAKIAANFIKKFDVIFYEALAYTSHIQTKTFIDLINNNEIGEILSANATFGFKVKRVKAKSRIFNKLLGGGAILDIGCYPFSLINLIFKNDKNINFKSTKGSFAITGVDDSAEANLIIGNKISSNIKISFKENLDNKVVINGKSGSLTLSNPWLPELKSFIQIDHANSNYKKFITSEKTVFGNQIQNVSTKIKEKKMNEDFLVDIESSLEIMKNLTIWSNLIKVQ
jgi:dihydrodiol dehydrogenase / D-xylose 1-dehydrogenase (NADP)